MDYTDDIATAYGALQAARRSVAQEVIDAGERQWVLLPGGSGAATPQWDAIYHLSLQIKELKRAFHFLPDDAADMDAVCDAINREIRRTASN